MLYRILEVLRLVRYRVGGAWREGLSLLAFPFSRRVPTCARCGEVVPPNPGNGPCRCGGRVINA